MPKTFSVWRSGQSLGRFTADQLRQIARAGKLQRTDVVCDDETGKRSPAESIKSLWPVPAAAAPPPPLPASRSVPLTPVVSVPPLPPETSPPGTDAATTIGPSGVALAFRLLGGLCVAIGVIDFILYNTRIFDIYAGLPFLSNGPLSLITAFVAMTVGGVLLRSANNARGRVSGAELAAAAGGGLIVMLVALSLAILAISTIVPSRDPYVDVVRMGSLQGCPTKTVGEMAASYMAKPRWESLVADDDARYVNLRGGIQFKGAPTEALLQFKVVGDNFELHAVEIGGEQQAKLVGLALLSKMCNGD